MKEKPEEGCSLEKQRRDQTTEGTETGKANEENPGGEGGDSRDRLRGLSLLPGACSVSDGAAALLVQPGIMDKEA